MPFSHHSHSGQFCGHASNTLEEMVQAAVARKMRIFALTEHAPRNKSEDLYPEEIEASQTVDNLFQIFDDFYHEAVRLRDKYASHIILLIGFESDWIRPSSRTLIGYLLTKYQFDFYIGSVHHVHGIPIDFDRAKYEEARTIAGGTDEDLYEAYFDAQFRMLQALKPPIIGHFDLIRLKGDEPDGDSRQYSGVWAKILRNLDFIVSFGGIMEINSAALRKGMSQPYPRQEICEAFLERGGRFALSDDSHAVEQVGVEYSRVRQFIREVGIQKLHYLEPDLKCEEHKSGKALVRSASLDSLMYWDSISDSISMMDGSR